MHETPRPPARPAGTPWVWAAVAVVAVAAIGVSTLHFVTAACAAVQVPAAALGPAQQPAAAGQGAGRGQPAGTGQARPPVVSAVTSGAGRAFFYSPGSGNGSCSFGRLPPRGLYASLGAAQYAAGAACGSYLAVTGPRGTVLAEVVDNCPGCSHGGIDLSEAAFSRIANPAAGTALVRYRLARDPRLPGPLAVRMAPSATGSALSFQVINHGNPLAGVDVAAAHRPGWQPLRLSPDNFWVDPSGPGPGPFRVRVTDIFGHRVVLDGIRLEPGAVQRTRVLMYAAGPSRTSQRAAAGPSGSPASASARASASGPASSGAAASPAASAAGTGRGTPGAAGHAAGRGRPAKTPSC